ncbi:MAG TPA: hypothetical protein VFE47_01620 [Tepidisphaeraceae bacterium]|nr:hypothetical protein [Tepidisphaeraceae bacterium]
MSASFKVVDLGVLPGGGTSAAYGINAAGTVVGNADVPHNIVDAFESNGAATPILKPIHGGAVTHAYSVNSRGDVTGETSVGNYQHAYFFSNGVMHDLGTLGGHTSFAYAINDADTIVGGSYIRGDKLVHAFIWTPLTGMKDLGTLGGGFSLAYAISPSGQIAGYSTNARGQNHAFLDVSGKMQDLGTLPGGALSISYAINATGQMAGAAKIGNNENAFICAAGKFTNLGTLGGSSSLAYGINNSAAAVGLSAIKGSTTTHAFVYHGGKMYDLNQEIAPGSGWTLLGAFAINNAGEIAGMGMIHGKTHGFLLIPIA